MLRHDSCRFILSFICHNHHGKKTIIFCVSINNKNRNRPGIDAKQVKIASFFIKTGFSFAQKGLDTSFTSSLVDDWKMYIHDNRLEHLSDKDKLVIFKAVFLNEFPNGEKLNEEEIEEFDESLEYEDYGYDKELADYFRELDQLTDEIEQRYYT